MALPLGLQTLAGITFDIRGIIQLRCAAPDSELFPDQATVTLKRSFGPIHVLHGTTGPSGTDVRSPPSCSTMQAAA